MCGLTGVYARVAPVEDAVRRMTDALVHRGPDAGDVWCDPAAGVALGHRRLAIVDLTPAGRQPMASASGRYVVAFNGEIYNHAALRGALERDGAAPAWRGHSDTETLLAGIEAWGIAAALGQCVGMFALAVFDRERRELTLARDRLGEKPLYYGWIGGAFAFGSEMKALRAHPDWRGDIDRDALALFLRYDYIPAPHSIYAGVRKLPPGTRLTLGASAIARRSLPEPVAYWALADAAAAGRRAPFAGDEREALAELERLLRGAIAQQCVADVPLGAFLSGGVDSSTVVALMQAQSAQPVRTFTIGFSEADYNEAEHAKRVARHLKTEHTELYVTPAQAMDVIPRLPAMYDEPFADSSQIPTFLVSQMARRHVTVSLSGDAGDELFGGYNRYFLVRDLCRKAMWLPHQARLALGRTIARAPAALLDVMMRPLGLVVPQFAVAQPSDKAYKAAEVLALTDGRAIYRRLVSHWDDPAAVVVGGREPASRLDALMAAPHDGGTFEQWMMNADLATYLPDDILVKVDRAAMAVSLETRAPFLDHRLVEFALSLPLSYKIRDGRGKWLLRQLLDKHVPRAVIDRPKMGFGVPIDAWLRGPLRPWAEALLDERRLAREGYLDPAPIRAKWAEHVSGRRNWQYQLWNVLMFEAWLEREGTAA